VAADGAFSIKTNGSIAVQSLTSSGLVNTLNNTYRSRCNNGRYQLASWWRHNHQWVDAKQITLTAGSGNITLNATLGSILYGGNVVSSMARSP